MRKVTLLAILFLCLFSSCTREANNLASVFYKQEDGTLFLVNAESANYINKLELNLEKDTLVLTTHKKLVSASQQFKASLFSKWKIKLDSTHTIKYLKYGDKTIELSEMQSPSKSSIETFYPSIEIFPKEFPYIATE